MVQDAMPAGFRDFQKHVLHGIAMKIRAERVHDGIEHAVRLHAFLPRSLSRIPETVATVEDAADIRSKMKADGELIAVTEAIPIISVAIPETRAITIIVPSTSI